MSDPIIVGENEVRQFDTAPPDEEEIADVDVTDDFTAMN